MRKLRFWSVPLLPLGSRCGDFLTLPTSVSAVHESFTSVEYTSMQTILSALEASCDNHAAAPPNVTVALTPYATFVPVSLSLQKHRSERHG